MRGLGDQNNGFFGIFFRRKQFVQRLFAVKHHGFALGVAQNGEHLGVFGVAEHKQRHAWRCMFRCNAVNLFDKRTGHVLDAKARIICRQGAERLLFPARDAVRADDHAGRHAALSNRLNIADAYRADARRGKMLVIRAVVNQVTERADVLALPDGMLHKVGGAAHAEAEARLFCYDDSHWF